MGSRKRRLLLVLDSRESEDPRHQIFRCALSSRFEVRATSVICLNLMGDKFLTAHSQAFLSLAEGMTAVDMVIFTSPEALALVQTDFKAYAFIPFIQHPNSGYCPPHRGSIKIAHTKKAVDYAFVHLAFCSGDNYPPIEFFTRPDPKCLPAVRINGIETILKALKMEDPPKPVITERELDFFVLFVTSHRDPQTQTVTCHFHGRGPKGERLITSRSYQDLCFFITSNFQPYKTNRLAQALPEVSKLKLNPNLMTTRIFETPATKPKVIALSNPVCLAPKLEQHVDKLAGFKLNYAKNSSVTYQALKYAKPMEQLGYRMWNAMGDIPEAMMRERVYCGFNGKTGEMMDLSLLRVGYLTSELGNENRQTIYGWKCGEVFTVCHTAETLISMIRKGGVDIIVCLGLWAMDEMGQTDSKALARACGPVCLLHLETSKTEIPCQRLVDEAIMRQKEDEHKLFSICCRMEEYEAREQLVHCLFVTMSYIGLCSLSDNLTEPMKMARILYRKYRQCEGYDLVSLPPFIEATKSGGENRGGLMLLEQVKPGEILKPVTVVDFKSFYPSACEETQTCDPVIKSCMRELTTLREIHAETERTSTNSKDRIHARAMQLGFKNVANIMTGCQWHMFPTQAEDRNANGRQVTKKP